MNQVQSPGLKSYLTLVVLFESHLVADVPALVPVTNTAMNLPFCAFANFNVLLVERDIFLQVMGTLALTVANFLVQEYHW